jgi:hypothetical protein
MASKVLGRSLDELPPQTRRFLDMVKEMVKKECERLQVERADYRVSRRQICEYTGWSMTQVRLHLDRLVEHEYVLVHRGSRGLSFVYELLYNGEGKQGEPFLMGLIDINLLKNTKKETQKHDYDEKVAGENGELAGPKRPKNGGVAGWFKAFGEQGFTLLFRERVRKRYIGGIKKMASYPYNRTINMEDKTAAKEKNRRLFPDILSRLKEYFYPLAAKEKKSLNNQKFLQMFHGTGTVFSKRVPGRRRQNKKEEELCHY